METIEQTPEQIAANLEAQKAAAAQAKKDAAEKAKQEKAEQKAKADALKKAAKEEADAKRAAAKKEQDDAKAAAKKAKDDAAAEKARLKAEEAAKNAEAKTKVVLPSQNGVTRPRPDGACGKVWAKADELSSNLGQPVPISTLIEHTRAAGLNDATTRTQYARWKTFNGVFGTVAKPAVAPAAAPAVAPTAEAQGVHTNDETVAA